MLIFAGVLVVAVVGVSGIVMMVWRAISIAEEQFTYYD